MSDLPTELRIIARDGGRLDASDRARIVEMVDHFEWMQSELAATREALFEANARRIAASERLGELQPQLAPCWSHSSGWVRLT